MDEARRTVREYVAAWNEPDEAARRRLLERCWTDGATYTDPSVHIADLDALVAHARLFAQRWPGAAIVLTGGIDVHNGMVRFAWQVRGPDGRALRAGVDFGELAADGRLQRIVGFFDPAPGG